MYTDNLYTMSLAAKAAQLHGPRLTAHHNALKANGDSQYVYREHDLEYITGLGQPQQAVFWSAHRQAHQSANHVDDSASANDFASAVFEPIRALLPNECSPSVHARLDNLQATFAETMNAQEHLLHGAQMREIHQAALDLLTFRAHTPDSDQERLACQYGSAAFKETMANPDAGNDVIIAAFRAGDSPLHSAISTVDVEYYYGKVTRLYPLCSYSDLERAQAFAGAAAKPLRAAVDQITQDIFMRDQGARQNDLFLRNLADTLERHHDQNPDVDRRRQSETVSQLREDFAGDRLSAQTQLVSDFIARHPDDWEERALALRLHHQNSMRESVVDATRAILNGDPQALGTARRAMHAASDRHIQLFAADAQAQNVIDEEISLLAT